MKNYFEHISVSQPAGIPDGNPPAVPCTGSPGPAPELKFPGPVKRFDSRSEFNYYTKALYWLYSVRQRVRFNKSSSIRSTV